MPADEPKKPTGHTVADHLYGQDLMHEHEDDSDHDHDWIDENERLEDNPLWIQDHVTLSTVGIDIGSAGTQIIFSRINLRRLVRIFPAVITLSRAKRCFNRRSR